MRKNVIFVLISLFLFNSFVYALPFDEQKLLQLKPLLSERLKTKAEEAKNTKIWPALLMGLLGAAVISVNQNQSSYTSNENIRLSNLMYGSLFLTIGADLYLSRTPLELNLELIDSLSQSGPEREKAAYLIFKQSGAMGKLMREQAGFIWTAYGLTSALLPLLVPNALQELRSAYTLMGLGFVVLGLMQYFMPSAAETEMRKIDAELVKQ